MNRPQSGAIVAIAGVILAAAVGLSVVAAPAPAAVKPAATAVSAELLGAIAKDWCERHPNNRKCPKPTPTPTLMSGGAPSPTPSVAPTATNPPATPTATATSTGSAVPTASSSSTPSPSPSPTPSPTPTSSPTTSPSSSPPATPTPRPTSTPTTAPTPSPSPTSTPGSACTRTFAGDATGSSDVTATLQQFLNGPSGVICLAPGGTYRITGPLHVSNWSNRTLDGRGATIRQTVRSTTRILLVDGGGSDIAIRNLTIQGSNPNPGKWDVAYEHNHCIQLGGTQRVEIDRLTCLNVGGDGLYLSGGANRWADQVWVHDSLFDGIGRMGVAITDGASNVVVETSRWRRIGYYTWDIEPNGATVGGRLAGGEKVAFRRNTIETKPYGDYPADPTQADGYVFVVTGASGGGPAIDVEIADNVMTDPTMGAFKIGVFNNGGARQGIRVTGNVGILRRPGPVMTFAGVNSLTVTGNTQPLSSGTLVSCSGCTNVTVADNNTVGALPATDTAAVGSLAAPIWGGLATWYPADGMVAAAGPGFRDRFPRWRGMAVSVCREGGNGRQLGPCVVVRVTDWCSCRQSEALLDLSDDAFRQLAPLSRGVIPIAITRAVRIPQPPATDTVR